MGRAGAAEPSGPWPESVATAAGRPWSGWGGPLALEPASLTGCSPHPVVDGDPAGTEVDHGDQGSGAVIAVAGIVDQAVLALGPFEARDRPGRARWRRGRVPDLFARSWRIRKNPGPHPARVSATQPSQTPVPAPGAHPQPHQGRPAAVATDSSPGPDGSAAPARPRPLPLLQRASNRSTDPAPPCPQAAPTMQATSLPPLDANLRSPTKARGEPVSGRIRPNVGPHQPETRLAAGTDVIPAASAASRQGDGPAHPGLNPRRCVPTRTAAPPAGGDRPPRTRGGRR